MYQAMSKVIIHRRTQRLRVLVVLLVIVYDVISIWSKLRFTPGSNPQGDGIGEASPKSVRYICLHFSTSDRRLHPALLCRDLFSVSVNPCLRSRARGA